MRLPVGLPGGTRSGAAGKAWDDRPTLEADGHDRDPRIAPPDAEQARALAVSRVRASPSSAGAGCGKTTVLAERFVRALEAPDARPLGRIVALTFTNKAARELRERIRRECRARLESGGDPARLAADPPGARGRPDRDVPLVLRRGPPPPRRSRPGSTPASPSSTSRSPWPSATRPSAVALRERLAARDPDLIELAVEFGLGMVRQALDDLLGEPLGRRHPRLGRPRAPGARRPLAGPLEPEVRPALLAGSRRPAGRASTCSDATESDHPKIRDRRGRADRRLRPALEAGADAGADPRRDPANWPRSRGSRRRLWPSAEVYERDQGPLRGDPRRGQEAAKSPPLGRAHVDAGRRPRPPVRPAGGPAREAYDRAKRARGGIDNDDLLLLTRDLLAGPPEAVRRSWPGRST